MAAFFHGEDRSGGELKARRRVDVDLELPLVLLRRYLFYLSRRPISASNLHYRSARVEGLRSLSAFFLDRPDPAAEIARNLLEALTPANIAQLAHAAEQKLRSLVPLPLPRDLVVSGNAPGGEFFKNIRNVLLVCGPGIGIGDEIICFPIPRRLKRMGFEVTVLTSYAGLWDHVADIRDIQIYESFQQLTNCLRSSDNSARWDLILMIDFEVPGLSLPMYREPSIKRYVEISLGSRTCVALDKAQSRAHQTPRFEPYFTNFYESVDHIGAWLGVKPQPLDRLRAVEEPVKDNRQKFLVLVSPFTSKQNPSPIYWGELLAKICVEGLEADVDFLLDTGPNQTTESFSLEVMRVARAQALSGVGFTFVEAKQRYASISDILECLRMVDLVIAADSFLAHAAPIFGVPALVIARRGTEAWRVPKARNFYFGISDPIPQTATAMRIILRELIETGRNQAKMGLRDHPECHRLMHATKRVENLFDTGDKAGAVEWCDAWDELHRAYSQVAAERRTWPQSLDGLFQDKEYDYLISPWPEAFGKSFAMIPKDFLVHLQDHFQQWINSNLQKYLNGLSHPFLGQELPNGS